MQQCPAENILTAQLHLHPSNCIITHCWEDPLVEPWVWAGRWGCLSVVTNYFCAVPRLTWHMLSSNSKSCIPTQRAQCLWFSVENLTVLNWHTHTQRDRGWAFLVPPFCFAFITLPCHLMFLSCHLWFLQVWFFFPPWIKECPSITQSDFPGSSRCSASRCVQSYQEPQVSVLRALPSPPKPQCCFVAVPQLTVISSTGKLQGAATSWKHQKRAGRTAAGRTAASAGELEAGQCPARSLQAPGGHRRRKKQPNRGEREEADSKPTKTQSHMSSFSYGASQYAEPAARLENSLAAINWKWRNKILKIPASPSEGNCSIPHCTKGQGIAKSTAKNSKWQLIYFSKFSWI